MRAIHYREEEAIYIKASHDRVTVIFSTRFSDETDRVFGKVFLQVRSHCACCPAGMLTWTIGVRGCQKESDSERSTGVVSK